MSATEPESVWRYRHRVFSTKLERDCYAEGFRDGLKEAQATHTRIDI